MLARLLALSLIAVITVATVVSPCDFDDNDCDSYRIVAETQVNPGIVADRTTPDRAKADGDPAAGPDPAGGHSGAWWVTHQPQPGLLDPPPRAAWFSPWTAPGLALIADPPPEIPPKA